MCSNCGQPNNQCNCPSNYCVPCNRAKNCPIKLDASCVMYHIEGEDDVPSLLNCLNLPNYTSVESILEKIDSLICNNGNISIQTQETFTAKITASGPSNHTIKTDVKVSDDDNNVIEIRPDGLYVQQVASENSDLQDVTDNGNITTNKMQCTGLGINIAATTGSPFKVNAGIDGNMFFDGIRLSVGTTTDHFTSNTFVGDNAGNLDLGGNCVSFGIKALARATGKNNTAIGKSAGISIISDDNTFIGASAGADTDNGENVFVGAGAGAHSYSDSSICIGAHTSVGAPSYTGSIPTSNIILGTSQLKGTAIAAFIVAAGLSVGSKGGFSMTFTGSNFPDPILTTPTSYKGYVIASDTIELQDTSSFTSISGVNSPFTLIYYKPVTNAISIGYQSEAADNNEILIGNSQSTKLSVNNFVVDTSVTPASRQMLIWNGTKYVPSSLLSGNYTANGDGATVNFVVTHGAGFIPNQIFLQARSGASVGAWISAKTSTTFTIAFTTPPVVGTNNINFFWFIL